MKKILLPAVFSILVACSNPKKENTGLRKKFTSTEQKLLNLSRDIIQRSYYATFITLDYGKPHPRVMEPFPPDSGWIVWLGTNAKSRKVNEIKRNPIASLHYFDRSIPAYVNLYGKAYLVNDPEIKDSIWRKSWEKFYPDKSNYILIKFITDSLEMINPSENLPGDSVTWKPYGVIIRHAKK